MGWFPPCHATPTLSSTAIRTADCHIWIRLHTHRQLEHLQWLYSAPLNMLRVNKIFIILYGISVEIIVCKTLPEQDTIPLNASEVQQTNLKSSLPGGDKLVLYSASEEPGKIQNISIKAVIQNTTAASLNSSGGSVQPPSELAQLFGIPLSLSSDSVDDMYLGCSEKMLIKVKRHYLPRSTREGLHTTYTKICALKAMQSKDFYDQLSFDHFRALCAYTAGSYSDLNQAVRKGKSSYNTTFEFHALHFLLSDAIRLLKLNQRSCYTTVRRSKLLFTGKPGQTMRFGSFASSSLNKELRHFGRRTCFEIRTCFGAYLKSYSEFDSDEDEILIPPFEMFNIVSVDKSGINHLNCDVLYKLEPAGIYSNLNCQAVNF